MEPLVTPVVGSTPMADVVRVLVADANDLLRLGVCTLLREEPSIAVVAEAADAEEAFDRVVRWAPDVVLLNVSLPGIGASVPDELVRASHVVVVTEVADCLAVTRAMAAGALSYLVYGQFEPSLLPTVVRQAAAGRPCLTSGAAAAVVDWFRRDASTVRGRLTTRECEVMDLLAEGLSNQDIAERLEVSIKTVKNHLHHAFRQLEVADRSSARLVWRRRHVRHERRDTSSVLANVS